MTLYDNAVDDMAQLLKGQTGVAGTNRLAHDLRPSQIFDRPSQIVDWPSQTGVGLVLDDFNEFRGRIHQYFLVFDTVTSIAVAPTKNQCGQAVCRKSCTCAGSVQEIVFMCRQWAGNRVHVEVVDRT